MTVPIGAAQIFRHEHTRLSLAPRPRGIGRNVSGAHRCAARGVRDETLNPQGLVRCPRGMAFLRLHGLRSAGVRTLFRRPGSTLALGLSASVAVIIPVANG
jgi:hypothetical protein